MNLFKKIVVFLVPLFLVIAIILKSNGVDYLTFDDKYWRFASNVLQVKKLLTLQIPNIPMIPKIDNNFADFVFGFINALSNIINVFVMLVNIVLEELVFILSFLASIFDGIRDIFMNGGQLCLNPSL